jgi:hypothetical protein
MNTNYKTAKGFLTENEREELKVRASQIPQNGFILNIGVEYGASLVCLWTGNPTATLVGVDIDNSKCEVKVLTSNLITQDSKELRKTWEQVVDLLFIDGEHTREAVLSDFSFAEVSPVGSFIVVHDCCEAQTGKPHPVCPAVNVAVDEWFTTHKVDWKELKPINSMRIFERVKYALADPVNSVADLQQK